MRLVQLTTAQIRSHVRFGAEGTAFLDGHACRDIPYGLHRIRGVYDVDVYNAVKHDEPEAWDLILDNAYIRE